MGPAVYRAMTRGDRRPFLPPVASQPNIVDGQLLLRSLILQDGSFSGTLFETDYASLLAGLECGAIGNVVKACFGVAALLTSDHAFMLGSMAAHTRNAGQILFPSGSIDPADVTDGCVDLGLSIARELAEETGIGADEVLPDPDRYPAFVGPRLPIFKIMRMRQSAQALRERMLAGLTQQTNPEFTDFRCVRSMRDLDPRMPDFRHVWR